MKSHCDVCGEPLTVEVSVERAKSGRWTCWPPVRAVEGNEGHIECLLRKGIISIGEKIGPEYVDYLDENFAASGLAPSGFHMTIRADGVLQRGIHTGMVKR